MNAQTAIRRIEAALRRLEGKPVEEDLLGLVPMGRQIGIGRGISAGLGGSRRGDCRGRALGRATSSGRSNFAIGRRDSSNRGSGFNNYGKGAGPSIGVVTHSYGRGNYGRIDGDTNSSSLFEVSGNRATNSFNPGRICTSLGRPETGTLLSGARRSGTLPGCSRHTDSSLKRK
ncbi:unnamed protein product [Protopolystoma xenopodis]|uniref:Uncharacterized protein n=1 Tax=Protopolystoma xenopodis TaxID=117903 RepID=A0A448WK40_9PLAT|nr:unnamed protein product [Protopolystoma xenopodis]